MRDNEARRVRAPWRTNPLLTRFTSAGAHLSAAMLLVTDFTSGLAARKNRNDDRQDRDGGSGNERNRDGDKDRDRENPRDEDRKEDRENRDVRREQSDDPDRNDGERNRDGTRRNERDGAADDDSNVNTQQQEARNRDDEPRNAGESGGGGGDGGGGNNAGSALFDSPLATKARRRSNDFDNRDRDEEGEDGIFVDVDPEGESIYETDSISFVTDPEGIEILTSNITYFAEPTPTPTPLPRFEFPPGDRTGVDPPRSDTDGGDNSMVFTS